MTIAQHHDKYLWTSWFWGILLALPCMVVVLYLSIEANFSSFDAVVKPVKEFLVSFSVVITAALLGNLLRRPFTLTLFQRAEAATSFATQVTWLAGGTLLLFVASVMVCQLAFMLFTFTILDTNLFVPMLRLFFIVSAPWLLTAPIAACWICRDRLQKQY